MNNQALSQFRKQYRAQMNPRYHPYWHVGFVFVFGAIYISYCFIQVDNIQGYELFGFFIALVLFNFIEYFVHIHLGHKKRKLAALFYKRHTGDHHSFYDDLNLVPLTAKDWRVTFFPAWLIVIVVISASLIAYGVAFVSTLNIGYFFAAGIVSGYLLYEFCHFCDHLPATHYLVQLPWLKQMRHLHRLHHKREFMQEKNFNLTFPLADIVFGTFYWQDPCDLEQELPVQ